MAVNSRDYGRLSIVVVYTYHPQVARIVSRIIHTRDTYSSESRYSLIVFSLGNSATTLVNNIRMQQTMTQEQPLFDRCNTLGQLAIILVATIGSPILFLVHIVTTFYSATFNKEDTQ